jgi:hypothetical protein
MKRLFVVAGLTLLVAAPAAAQFAGMPVWNSPKGGTGVTINGDMGLPNADAGKGTAFGARAALGLANLTLSAGVSTWTPDGFDKGFTSFGGTAAFRVIGGSLMPVAINLLAGAARTSEITSGVITFPASTNIIAGGGISAGLPTPGVSIEPYVTVTNRWVAVSGNTNSNVGVTFGANLGFGLFGLHLAYDTMSDSGVTTSIFGVGVHVSLKAPIGM